ncbi:MAG: hypothetical protein U1F43_19510 [Myxococcota bacterium]
MSRLALLCSVVALATVACNDEDKKGSGDATSGDATTASDATVANDATVASDATTATDATADTADTATGPACENSGDCVHCMLDKTITSTAECECKAPCSDYISNADACDAANASWDTYCAGSKWADTANCPIARCTAPDPLYCHEGQCEDACSAVTCAPLECPLEEQTRPPGECCPRCVGPTACTTGDDCVMCATPTPVASADECYCVICASTPMLKSECETNNKSWTKYCDPWPKPEQCPVAGCIPGAPPVCDLPSGTCAADPYACFDNTDCTTCSGTMPTNPSECACPMCPHAGSVQECEDIQTATDLYCADFDFSKCPVPPCVFPGEPACDQFGTWHCSMSHTGTP